MVHSIGVQNQNIRNASVMSFGKEDKANSDKSECENHDRLMYDEKKKHPIKTAAKIQADKFVNAFTRYPKKGMEGSKNANFYQFLTMGMVPYLTGSAMMIAVFNLASKFFDTPAAKSASMLGKRMGLGVIFYGLGKTFSKKLIETPVNLKYGIDVNLPYEKVIYELPEGSNTDNLVTREYHKAFESVDFPRWDLFYDNESFGPDRNSYYAKAGKKMGMDDEDLEHADQKVKPKIKEKVVKTRLYSTLSSYLWAATGVGIAMQDPFKDMVVNPLKRYQNYRNYMDFKTNGGLSANIKNPLKRLKIYKDLPKTVKQGGDNAVKYSYFVKDFGKRFVESCKQFVNNKSKSTKIAGRILLGSAIGMTLLGNFATLSDFNNKKAKAQASSSLIDESKEKVVC